MTSKYLFLIGSQCTTQDKDKMENQTQATCMSIEPDNSSLMLEEHAANSHLCIDGKVFICLEAIQGRSNCQFCIMNSFSALKYSYIDAQQNLILHFKNQQESSIHQINERQNNLANNYSPEMITIQNLIQQILAKKQGKRWSDESSSSSCLSLSTNLSIPKVEDLYTQKSPFLCFSFGNKEQGDQSMQIHLSQQFLQILDWNAEEMQLEIYSKGMIEFSAGYNLNEPLIWLLSQLSQNNTANASYSNESPLFAQQYINKKKQIINALVQYEVVSAPQRFYLIVKIKQIESTLGRRYPSRHNKEQGKTNGQLETIQNISHYFNQHSSQLKQIDFIQERENILSFEEIQFIEKYHEQNLAINHPQLVSKHLKTCNYRLI